MNVNDGLTNGAMGTVSNVVTRSQDGKLLVEAIHVGTGAILQSKYMDVNDCAVPTE